MDWLIYFFGSGFAFFVGVAFILAAIGVSFSSRRWLKPAATLFAVFGLILIAFSATPLPYWFYSIAGLTTLAWLCAERIKREWLRSRRNWFRAAAAAIWLIAVGMEMPYQFSPRVTATDRPTLFIIGDSVAAGVDDREKRTWPRLLTYSHQVEVVDLSRPGAKASSAMRQAEKLPAKGGIVLLEIGGNDVLGSTTVAEFEQHLARLLDRVCVPGRVVLMFELPLPPFCNDYGRVQRRLAAEHGVLLIPKRVFVAVLTGDGATLDSVHLAPQGHARMAETVWELIGNAYRE